MFRMNMSPVCPANFLTTLDGIRIFSFPRDSSDKSQLSIRIRDKSGRLATPSEQQLGQPATSERDATSATASGRAGSSGTGCPGCAGRSGFSATTSDDVAPATRPSTQLSHESLHGT